MPALFTLAAWYKSHCSGQKYDHFEAARQSIPHFLDEVNRVTNVGFNESHDNGKIEVPADSDLNADEIEMLYHMYWLPYAHGPKAQNMLDEFAWLKTTAHIIKNIDFGQDIAIDHSPMSSSSSTSSTSSAIESRSPFAVEWIRRASQYTAGCKKVFKMLDKWTYVKNRELFFDLNPYLNNAQVILRAANRYLKWVSIDKCAKPISGGPSLAGLMGGFAGDMARLYPITDKKMYPLRDIPESSVSIGACAVVRPVMSRDKSILKSLLKQSQEERNSTAACFGSAIAESGDYSGFVVEVKGQVEALVVASKNVTSLLKSVKKMITAPDKKLDVIGKSCQCIATMFVCSRDLYFSQSLLRMVEVFFESQPKEGSNVTMLVDKSEDLAMSFLQWGLKLRKTNEIGDLFAIKKA